MESIKQLPYITYKETDESGRTEFRYVTFNQISEKECNANIWSKAIQCGSCDFPDEQTALDTIQNYFIAKLKDLKNMVINIKKTYIDNKDINIYFIS